MTPREHLAQLIVMNDDLTRAIEGQAAFLDDEPAYWDNLVSHVESEAHFVNDLIGDAEEQWDKEADPTFTDDPQLQERIDRLVALCRE